MLMQVSKKRLVWTKTCKITRMVINIFTTKKSTEDRAVAQAGQVKCQTSSPFI